MATTGNENRSRVRMSPSSAPAPGMDRMRTPMAFQMDTLEAAQIGECSLLPKRIVLTRTSPSPVAPGYSTPVLGARRQPRRRTCGLEAAFRRATDAKEASRWGTEWRESRAGEGGQGGRFESATAYPLLGSLRGLILVISLIMLL